MDANVFGSFICERRKELGLTQSELGSRISVTGKAISRWERGIGYPDINLIEPLSNELGVTIMELMTSETKADNVDYKSENEILNETIRYLNKRKKSVRVRCIIACCLAFITMILGIYLSCRYVLDLRLRAIFTLLLIYTASTSNSILFNYFLKE